MRFWLHRFRKLDMAKKEHRQMLIDVFINAIFLYDDKMLITFNYKEGTKTITFDDVKNEVSEETLGSDLTSLAAPKKNHNFDTKLWFFFYIIFRVFLQYSFLSVRILLFLL